MRWGLLARAFLRFGELLGAAAWWLGVRKPVALDGLARAFPEASAGERRRLGSDAYRQLGRSLCELFLVRGASDAQLEQLIRFEGWEIYETERGRGRGVVCAIAHFGNFELLARATARRGVRLSIIVRRLNDFFGRWLEGDRDRMGARGLPARGSSKAALEVLRRQEVLAVAVDQNMQKSRGVFVDFFGSPACTTPAAAVFSLRAGAPLLAAFPIRQPDGTHVVRVLGPFETALAGRAAVLDLTQQLTKAVEEQVREHPDHWYWVHRRWKTQP